MLVIKRKVDEGLIIGDNIEVTILAIEGDKIKIGISAPKEVPIFRKELHQAIQEQNQIVEKLTQSKEENDLEPLRKKLIEALLEEEQTAEPEEQAA